jgi:hypothetical protein
MNRDDIIRLAEQAGIVFRLTSTDITVEKLERFLALAQGPRTRGFLWFWLRPEGCEYKTGLNLTLPGNGFVLTLYTQRFKYRFRYRRDIKPRFLWSRES